MTKLNSGFSTLTDDQFYIKGKALYAALFGNANFPLTSPTLAVLLALLGPLEAALALPAGQARDTAVAASRADVQAALETIATNLELIPNVTDVMLATSGFDLSATNAHTGAGPTQPQGLHLAPTGVSGEVKLVFKASQNARGYEIEWTLDPNGAEWQGREFFSSSRDVILKGLVRKTDVWCRVRAVGVGNQKSAWSDPATMLVA
jgi:hypothetical protein